jgi:hypothetical protein
MKGFKCGEEENDGFGKHTHHKHDVSTRPVKDLKQSTTNNYGSTPSVQLGHEILVTIGSN